MVKVGWRGELVGTVSQVLRANTLGARNIEAKAQVFNTNKAVLLTWYKTQDFKSFRTRQLLVFYDLTNTVGFSILKLVSVMIFLIIYVQCTNVFTSFCA